MTISHTFSATPSASRRSAEYRAGLLAEPGFSQIFAYHMVTIGWSEGTGWHDACVRARPPFRNPMPNDEVIRLNGAIRIAPR
jgi:hypothetical protein